MAGRRRKEPYAADHRAAFFVDRPEVEAPDARERNRRRAHGAGLQRHVEVGVVEPLGAELRGAFADHQHFRMRRDSSKFARAVAGLGDGPIACASTAPTGTSPRARRGLGFGKRQTHEIRTFHRCITETFPSLGGNVTATPRRERQSPMDDDSKKPPRGGKPRAGGQAAGKSRGAARERSAGPAPRVASRARGGGSATSRLSAARPASRFALAASRAGRRGEATVANRKQAASSRSRAR